ncbi:MAG TPA: SGNH/GDSL hydrolase family protein [Vicinamibacteria bacterium]|nr:SGNH/GDSL hydrolase family protein [Vicinamibacteria bacterium]
MRVHGAGRRLGRAAAYAAVVLLFFELASRALLSSEAFFLRVASSRTEPSWRLQWVKRHRQLAGALRFGVDIPHPTRGWALRPGLRDSAGPGGKPVSSNSRGLRGRREYAIPKPVGVKRLLFLGDSFTFGEGVGDAETFCHRLQGLLPAVEVLNLGVHGYGHDQMLVTLREEGPRYQPDVVALGYVTDDALRNLMRFRDSAKPRFELRDGRLLLTGVPVPTPSQILAAEPYRSKFLDLLTMLKQQADWRSGRRPQEMLDLTRAILDEFFATARGLGAQPVVIDLPVWRELENQHTAPAPREQFLADHCRRREIPYLSLRPRFVHHRQQGGRLETQEHWGPGEHALAAEGIADFLNQRGFLRSEASRDPAAGL